EYEAYIQILPFTQLNEIISSYPFIKNESEHCYIVFTQKKSTIAELLEAFQNTENPSEQVTKSIDNERIIYWQTSKGHSTNSAFAKILLQKKFKSTTTVRNINTLQKMVQY
nr:hypothetical protein [Pseudarcicella sp.]